jgi:hypothetical protein
MRMTDKRGGSATDLVTIKQIDSTPKLKPYNQKKGGFLYYRTGSKQTLHPSEQIFLRNQCKMVKCGWG